MNKVDEAIESARQTGKAVYDENFVVLPETVTTMADADEAIKRGAPHGFNVIANRMTGGVGTTDAQTGKKRAWVSLEGNLLVSKVVGIRREQGEHERHIDWIASLAAGEVAGQYVKDPNVKLVWHWPNDLWRQKDDGSHAKWGGILVPLGIHPNDPNKVVLGMGINILSAPAPDEARLGSAVKSFTSLHECGAKDVTVGGFLEKFDQKFEEHLAVFRRDGDFTPVLEKMGYAKPNTGGTITLKFKDSVKEVSGRFAGFDTEKNEIGVPVGYLRLKDADGAVRRFSTWELYMTSPIPR